MPFRITAKAADNETALSMINEMEMKARERLGDHVYGIDDEDLETVVVRMLIERGLKLALAESCTGGLVANRITNVPGSSETLLAGVVAYSNKAKTDLLGVPSALIMEHGAVSAEVAEAMASGAASRTDADIAVGITGIAGPSGGSEEKPVGLVYIALKNAGRGKLNTQHVRRWPTPDKRALSATALIMIRTYLLGQNPA